MSSSQKTGLKIIRSKRYLIYLIGLLSFFVAFRAYTIDGSKTTALVWYFFPNVTFEEGLGYLSYMGVIAGLGSFSSIFLQKWADKIGRKPILVLTSVILTVMPLIQILSGSFLVFTITSFFLVVATNINIWMIFINEESPQGKNATWSTLILIIGLIGPVIFYVNRAIFITNDKAFTILHWKGILYFSVVAGIIVTILLVFTIKETSAFEYKAKLGNGEPLNVEKSTSFSKGVKIIFKGKRKNSYLVLIIVSILFTIAVGSGNLLEPYFMNYSLVSSEEFSLISMIGLFGLAFFYIFTGKIADWFGRRILLILYGFFYPVSVILQFTWGAHIPNADFRFIIMIILKIFGMSTRAGLWALLMIISIEIIPTEVRGIGNGILTLVMNIIGLTLSLITAPLFKALGIRPIALILTCFMFLIIPLVIKYIPESFGLDLKEVK
jgi:putative MFS transporter